MVMLVSTFGKFRCLFRNDIHLVYGFVLSQTRFCFKLNTLLKNIRFM